MLKLSVIIPIYNVQEYLPACLDSVLEPKAEDYEIRVIHTPNGGLGHARNTGLEAAEGKYLLFLDSDDTLARGALREILDSLDDSFDVGLFDFITVNESGRQLEYTSGCERQGRFTLEEYPQLLFAPPNAVNKLWRRRLFTENGIRFPDRQWFEDLATSPRLYLRAERIRAVPRPWLRYLQRAGSITNAKDPSRNREIIDALQIVRDDFEARGALDKYAAELEILAVKHQLLASTVRVNLAAPKHPLQRELLADLDQKCPNWRENRYLPALPAQHRLLLKLMDKGRYGAVHALMTANNLLKGKKL